MWILGLIAALALLAGWGSWMRDKKEKGELDSWDVLSLLAGKTKDDSTPDYEAELDPAPKRTELEQWWEKLNSPPDKSAPLILTPCYQKQPHEAHYYGEYRDEYCVGVVEPETYTVQADDQIVAAFRTPPATFVLDNGCQCGPGEECEICTHAKQWHEQRRPEKSNMILCGCDRKWCESGTPRCDQYKPPQQRQLLHSKSCGCYACGEKDGCSCKDCEPKYRFPL